MTTSVNYKATAEARGLDSREPVCTITGFSAAEPSGSLSTAASDYEFMSYDCTHCRPTVLQYWRLSYSGRTKLKQHVTDKLEVVSHGPHSAQPPRRVRPLT